METEGYGMTGAGNESYLAGAILIDGANVLPVVRGLVKPEDFQVEAYRAVFTAAASLAADGEPVDPPFYQGQGEAAGRGAAQPTANGADGGRTDLHQCGGLRPSCGGGRACTANQGVGYPDSGRYRFQP